MLSTPHQRLSLPSHWARNAYKCCRTGRDEREWHLLAPSCSIFCVKHACRSCSTVNAPRSRRLHLTTACRKVVTERGEPGAGMALEVTRLDGHRGRDEEAVMKDSRWRRPRSQCWPPIFGGGNHVDSVGETEIGRDPAPQQLPSRGPGRPETRQLAPRRAIWTACEWIRSSTPTASYVFVEGDRGLID